MKKSILPLLALFMALPSLADVDLRSGTTDTAISGYLGKKVARKGVASDYHAVNHLSAGERWDAPCELTVYKSDMNYNEDSLVASWDKCTTTSANKTVGWLNNSKIKVRGIQVCSNNKSNHRLKGIRLYGMAIHNNGSYTIQTGYEEFKRANCKRWHTPVYCPTGQVATKVIIHSTNNEINGLGLACRKVQNA